MSRSDDLFDVDRRPCSDSRHVTAPYKLALYYYYYYTISLRALVIVKEMISRELRAGLPLELLYADNLILMAESEESLRDKIVKWKSGLEAKGLKMNTGKTKVMFSCSMKDKLEEKGKWPCGVCKKGVGNNSI